MTIQRAVEAASLLRREEHIAPNADISVQSKVVQTKETSEVHP
ncbi:MAG TPA: hypothetical protein VJ023_15860 [Pyrinomonadaceae bacterium]|nr:hypothetical protein [Pyrinomonadaceae bacterium]